MPIAGRTDTRPGWANYGKVDLFAPGVDIAVAGGSGFNTYLTSYGTSLSAPAVAGAAALYLEDHPAASPAEVRDALLGNATPNVVQNAGHDSANRLLYVGAVTAPAARSGMTWGKISHTAANGIDHVGCLGCNAYSGDTVCSTALPLLCIRTDGTPVPSGVTVDFNNGWIGGTIGLTAQVRGDQLISRANANLICQNSFGSGYQAAEFHHPLGGWSWSSRGNVDPSTRFWVSIDDQPANCWNP
jgi:hypothetical protein